MIFIINLTLRFCGNFRSDSIIIVTDILPAIGIGERLAWFWILLAVIIGLALVGVLVAVLHKVSFSNDLIMHIRDKKCKKR